MSTLQSTHLEPATTQTATKKKSQEKENIVTSLLPYLTLGTFEPVRIASPSWKGVHACHKATRTRLIIRFSEGYNDSDMARISKTLLRFGRKRNEGAVQLLRNKYRLPTELWIIILNMAIHIIVSLHEIGAPSDLPQCIYELGSLGETLSSSRIADRMKGWAKLNSWRNLRLVCQSWAAMINPRCTYSVSLIDHAHLRGLFDVQTLGIRDHSGWDAFSIESPYHKDLLLTASTITTVDIYQPPNHKRSMSGFIAYFIANPQCFTNLTSLSIEGYHSLDHRFWSGLEMGYPDLIFLAIRHCNRSSGAATLSKLKTLFVRVENLESTLTLPSLKHLIIWSDRVCMDFIKRQYALGLESLVIWTYSNLPFKISDTTILFPNLRMFGTNIECLKDMRDHPLAGTAGSQRGISLPEHLWLTPRMPASDANNLIDRFRGVNRLTFRIASTSSYSAYLLRRRCRNNNIELVNASQWVAL